MERPGVIGVKVNMMELKECDLCLPCSSMVGTVKHSSSQPVHRRTYGSLQSSSIPCPICPFILSLYPDWTAPTGPYATLEGNVWSSEGQPFVEISLEAAQRMQTGITWTFWNATLINKNPSLEFVTYFTLVVHQSEGKKESEQQ